MIEILINPESWDLIKNKTKTRELRLADDEQLLELKVAHPFYFVKRGTDERVKRWLIAKHSYRHTEEAIKHEPLAEFGHDLADEEFLERIRKWQSRAEEELAGVVVIEFA